MRLNPAINALLSVSTAQAVCNLCHTLIAGSNNSNPRVPCRCFWSQWYQHLLLIHLFVCHCNIALAKPMMLHVLFHCIYECVHHMCCQCFCSVQVEQVWNQLSMWTCHPWIGRYVPTAAGALAPAFFHDISPSHPAAVDFSVIHATAVARAGMCGLHVLQAQPAPDPPEVVMESDSPPQQMSSKVRQMGFHASCQ